MNGFLLAIFVFFSFMGIVNAQTEDVTLVFKRPYFTDGSAEFDGAFINVNGKKICDLNSKSGKQISACEPYKVPSGEVRIVISSTRGDDFLYVIDTEKNREYTFVVYLHAQQTFDVVASAISNLLIKNKAIEQEYSSFTFKTRLVAIK